MCIVPLIRFTISVCILLHYILFGANYFPELFYFHAFSCQLCYVECTCFVIVIREAVRTVIEWIFQVECFCCFIHFFQEIQDLRVVTKLAAFLNILTLFYIERNIQIWFRSTWTCYILKFLFARLGRILGHGSVNARSINITIILVVQALVTRIVFLLWPFSF